MTKGQRAGNSAIAVEVEKGKSYYWCACGQSKNQQINFVMALIKELNLTQPFSWI